MTRVINIRSLSKPQQDAVIHGELDGYVYIGRGDRSPGSKGEFGKWGNRYSHLASKIPGVVKVSSREEAITAYRVEKASTPGFIDKCRRELKDKTLVCWCKPAACHGDVLARWADSDENDSTGNGLFKAREEKKDMARTTTKTKTIDVTPTHVNGVSVSAVPAKLDPTALAARDYVSSKTAVVLKEIADITIASNDEYHEADVLLVRIRQARKIVADKLDPIIKPAYAALQGLYALRSELDGPLEKGEKTVKGKMAQWQAHERQRIEDEQRQAREEERRREEEERRAREEAERASAAARTKKDREEAQRLQREADARERERVEAEERRRAAEATTTVKGVGSKVTVVKKPVVTDLSAFIAGVVKGEVPEICLTVNDEVFKAYWEGDRGLVSSWPGVTVIDETRVGGR